MYISQAEEQIGLICGVPSSPALSSSIYCGLLWTLHIHTHTCYVWNGSSCSRHRITTKFSFGKKIYNLISFKIETANMNLLLVVISENQYHLVDWRVFFVLLCLQLVYGDFCVYVEWLGVSYCVNCLNWTWFVNIFAGIEVSKEPKTGVLVPKERLSPWVDHFKMEDNKL